MPEQFPFLPIAGLAHVLDKSARYTARVDRSARMKRSFYGEADYTFGQAMLTLRTSIGLTQAGLAELLGVSRRAIGKWEAGDSYPKASHLQALLAFAVGQRAFPAGREEEEIRAFWHAAHQKVLLEEAWLQGLLGTQRPRLVLVTAQSDEQVMAQPVLGPRVDWGEALDVPSFYGREEELATLEQWVVQERCRVVSVLGLGGIGKSALAARVMHRVAMQFEVVLWRSLRDAPTCEVLLEACLQVLAPQPLREVPASLEGRLDLLMEHLRNQRALVVPAGLLGVGTRGGRGRLEEWRWVWGTPLSRGRVLEAIEALRRRSLLERGKRQGSFTLQSVVLEYATAQLIAEASSEIEQGRLARLIEHGLALATAREDVRQTQQRLIVAPILARLRNVYPQRTEVEEHLLALLDQLRARADYAQGYGPANLLALLREHRGHLRGLDLSQLVMRGASLQGVEMQDTTLAGVTVRDSTFSEAFAATRAVAISNDGTYWAGGGMGGEVRGWRQEGKLLHLAWQAHTDAVAALAFSPDGRTLATGSWDGFIKLWELERGALLWTSRHTDIIHCLAFSPDGGTLASGGNNATVRLWDSSSGTHLQTLTGDSGPVYSVAWSPG